MDEPGPNIEQLNNSGFVGQSIFWSRRDRISRNLVAAVRIARRHIRVLYRSDVAGQRQGRGALRSDAGSIGRGRWRQY